jgi:DNA-binding response OmpR family regulator
MSLAKILVVDDETEIVRAVSLRLKAAGYTVIAAHDGMMATQLAIHESPDLVIMDIGMPCGNGHVVMERLLNNVETESTPVIFLTARTGEADRNKALANQAAGYVTKPFNPNELLQTVSQALSARRLRAGNAYTAADL